MSTVFMFPGQGSQKPGMGESLLSRPAAKTVFGEASEVFGFDVAKIMLESDQETLNQTKNAQACIVALSLTVAHELIEAEVNPAAVLGFSLGQIAALEVAGVMDLHSMFSLLNDRAEAMDYAVSHSDGVMSALLGGTDAEVEALCLECAQGEVVVPANYNCPKQIVVSGDRTAVTRAEEEWKTRGNKAIRLATAGAFHSPLMMPAYERFRESLKKYSFADARIELIGNADAAPFVSSDAERILSEHLISPVRFTQSVERLCAEGADAFVEVGFGGVLTGLVRKIDKSVERIKVQDEKSLLEAISSIR